MFASHLADERKFPDFWAAWENFEGRHGNVNTWREMTRIRRSIAAAFSATHFNTTNVEAAAATTAAAAGAATGAAVDAIVDTDDPMAALEAAKAAEAAAAAGGGRVGVSGFVSGGVQGGNAGTGGDGGAQPPEAVHNPEELDIGDDDDD